ncbi:hypothetical protein E2K93_17170 [Thalassotalea sp. HSM 43]|uniref:hypothetical protein n=1 Tax=Thalassotalea sp. HSM 43 TaxID=2552945 RepID=UPI0010819A90|nr:hypothetical protein [Thalassotalea sp. HSM 43]QBY05988.1 hypothetical protein E2K93_17170 [Thalassotalea sp. HSM 43]
MRNVLIVLVLLLSCFVSYKFGNSQAVINKQNENLGAIITMQSLMYDQQPKVRLLSAIYENIEEDPELAKKNIKLALILTYEDDVRLKSVFNEYLGTNHHAIKTNMAIDDFFIKYPISQCKNTPKNNLMSCNIKKGL